MILRKGTLFSAASSFKILEGLFVDAGSKGPPGGSNESSWVGICLVGPVPSTVPSIVFYRFLVYPIGIPGEVGYECNFKVCC